jgi:ribosomal protein S21
VHGATQVRKKYTRETPNEEEKKNEENLQIDQNKSNHRQSSNGKGY